MRILFVCTGNICRSPTAEAVLRGKLETAGLSPLVEVDSAGMEGWHAGKPPDPRSIAAAGRRGYPMAGLRARKITKRDLTSFDMLVAMDRGHHRGMQQLLPEAAERLFHFMEFAPDASPAQGLARLDVPDPYYGPDEDFELVLDIVEEGVEGLVDALRKSGLGLN